MFRRLIKTNNSRHSSIAYNDQDLLISQENPVASTEELEANIEAFRKTETNGFKAIPLQDITLLKVRDKHDEFLVRYQVSNKIRKYRFSIKDSGLRLEFCDALKNQLGLKQEQISEERLAHFGIRLVLILLISSLTWFLAHVSNAGIGRSSRAMANTAAEFLNWIGPELIYGLGAGLVLYVIFKIITTLINPGKTFCYTKNLTNGH